MRNSQWKLSYYSLFVLIGGVIGSSIVGFDLYYILGALSGSLLMVFINIIYVIYTNKRFNSNKINED